MKQARSGKNFAAASQGVDAGMLNKFAPRLDWSPPGESEHLVQFYEMEGFFLSSVSLYLGTGINAGEAVLAFATRAHLESIETRLQALGINVAAARATGAYVPMEAAETLPKLMVDGNLDPESFTETVEPIIKQAAADGRHVRVFGEMVALLWADRKYDAAISLETCWNRLQAVHQFLLLCAYPVEEFAGEASTDLLEKVCQEHSRIIPADGYMALANPEDRLRTVALLQQKAAALHAEITERKETEERLRLSENRYRRLFEEARDGILMIDPETHIITDANPSITELLGFTHEELLGRAFWEVGVFADRESASQALRQLRQKPVIRYDHLSIRTRSGQQREVELVNNLYQANGHKVIQCNLRDITERKQAEDLRSHQPPLLSRRMMRSSAKRSMAPS